VRVTKPVLIGIVIVGCILGALSAPVASDPFLKEIRFKKVSDSQEKVFFLLSGFYPPEIFGLKGENPRVVCDFFNIRLGDVLPGEIDTNGALIHSIRVGVHEASPPKVRVVLDLAPDRDYDIQQEFFQEERVFLITVILLEGRPKQ